jgi:DNA-binding MarR family transcriptional regulator
VGGATGEANARVRSDASFRGLLAAMDGKCNSFASRRAARYLSASYDRVLAPSGLRTTQFTILHKLALAERASISELADVIAMDRTTLATNLKPLERDGLLTVRPDEHDRRSRTVEITESGLAKLEEAVPLWQAAQNRFEGAFGSKEAADLRTALRAVLDTNLDPWAE